MQKQRVLGDDCRELREEIYCITIRLFSPERYPRHLVQLNALLCRTARTRGLSATQGIWCNLMLYSPERRGLKNAGDFIHCNSERLLERWAAGAWPIAARQDKLMKTNGKTLAPNRIKNQTDQTDSEQILIPSPGESWVAQGGQGSLWRITKNLEHNATRKAFCGNGSGHGDPC